METNQRWKEIRWNFSTLRLADPGPQGDRAKQGAGGGATCQVGHHEVFQQFDVDNDVNIDGDGDVDVDVRVDVDDDVDVARCCH